MDRHGCARVKGRCRGRTREVVFHINGSTAGSAVSIANGGECETRGWYFHLYGHGAAEDLLGGAVCPMNASLNFFPGHPAPSWKIIE